MDARPADRTAIGKPSCPSASRQGESRGESVSIQSPWSTYELRWPPGVERLRRREDDRQPLLYTTNASTSGELVYFRLTKNHMHYALSCSLLNRSTSLRYTPNGRILEKADMQDGWAFAVGANDIYILSSHLISLLHLDKTTKIWLEVKLGANGRPVERLQSSVVASGAKIFLSGGYDGKTRRSLSDVWELDLETAKWNRLIPSPLSPVLKGRNSHSSVTNGTKIYLFGGRVHGALTNATWEFDLPLRTWKRLSCSGDRVDAREGHSAVLVDDVMYVFGGLNSAGETLCDFAALKISGSGGSWVQLRKFPGFATDPGAPPLMATLGSMIHIFGGWSAQRGRWSDVVRSQEDIQASNTVHVLNTEFIMEYHSSQSSHVREGEIPGFLPVPGVEVSLSKELALHLAEGLQKDLDTSEWSLVRKVPRETRKVKSMDSGGRPTPVDKTSNPVSLTEMDKEEAIDGNDFCDIFSGIETVLTSEDSHLVEILNGGRSVGGGGFCDMYEGVHCLTGQRLAMKRPRRLVKYGDSDDIVRRFYREAHNWSTFDHASILPFFGLVEINNDLYMISPWMKKGDLTRFLGRRKLYLRRLETGEEQSNFDPLYLTFDESTAILQIAQGIAYLHSIKYVHGDLNSGNVLLAEDGHLLLCDFGLSKFSGDVTSKGLKGVGSIRWMAPELLDNVQKSSASDVYAFAMIIAEILTGAIPFPELQDYSIVMRVVGQGERPPKSPGSRQGVDFKPLWDLASRCWKTKPEDRISMRGAISILESPVPKLITRRMHTN